jgi:hypothetical protein
MGPFRASQALSWLSGPQTMYRLNHPLIEPDSKDGSVFALFYLSGNFQYYSLHTNTYQNVEKMSSLFLIRYMLDYIKLYKLKV